MKSLFMVFVLFLNANGTLTIQRTVDKGNVATAYAALRWLSNPAHWDSTITPIDGFVLERHVTHESWQELVYNPDYRASQVIFYDDKMLLIPRVECP